jgi:hypothetical protein
MDGSTAEAKPFALNEEMPTLHCIANHADNNNIHAFTGKKTPRSNRKRLYHIT